MDSKILAQAWSDIVKISRLCLSFCGLAFCATAFGYNVGIVPEGWIFPKFEGPQPALKSK